MGEALARETLGRFLNSLLLGLGYWTAFGNELRQTWADKLVGSRVVTRPVRAGVRRALVLVALLALVFDIAATTLGSFVERYEGADAALASLWDEIIRQDDSLTVVYGRPAADTSAYARDMRQVLDLSSTYDLALEQARTHATTLRATAVIPWTADRRIVAVLDSMVGNRQHASAIRQDVARRVIATGFDASGAPRERRIIEYLDSDLTAADVEMERLRSQLVELVE